MTPEQIKANAYIGVWIANSIKHVQSKDPEKHFKLIIMRCDLAIKTGYPTRVSFENKTIKHLENGERLTELQIRTMKLIYNNQERYKQHVARKLRKILKED